MSTDLIQVDSFDTAIQDLQKTKKLCAELIKLPHYAKMGEVGIYAITEKAKQIGMHPLEALNGGMYFVNGKVEMQGQAMLALIRKHGHSVTMDPKSTNTHVILHGKRADTGDMWSVSFGIEDAKRAGIYRGVWEKYPQSMCVWRCTSMLGRFLFSDILKGCYVVGEISEAPALDTPVQLLEAEIVNVEKAVITKEQADEIHTLLSQCEPTLAKRITDFYIPKKYASFYEFPATPSHLYDDLYERLCKERDLYQEKLKVEEFEQVMNGE